MVSDSMSDGNSCCISSITVLEAMTLIESYSIRALFVIR